MAERSDCKAKKLYAQYLKSQGFTNVKIISSPADVSAFFKDEKWYFEIKYTNEDRRYFGAATETEWSQAYKDPDHFKFVVVQRIKDNSFRFAEFTPKQFEEYSTIPPFKVYFNIDLDNISSKWHDLEENDIVIEHEKCSKTHNSIKLNRDNFQRIKRAFGKKKLCE